MCNTIIAQPLSIMRIRNPLNDISLIDSHRETPRPQDIDKALAILESGKMEIILTKHNTAVLARWVSEDKQRQGQEYWIDPSGCECGWWKFGGTCKHYIAFNLIRLSFAYAHDYVQAERVISEFEQDKRLMIVAKLMRKTVRLVQNIKEGVATPIDNIILPEGFPCVYCGEALDFTVCLNCHKMLDAYKLPSLAKFCKQCKHRKAPKDDICKTCENINKAAKRDTQNKIEAEFEQEIDQFFSDEPTLQDDINLLFDSSAAPSQPVKITNAIRKASPTTRKRRNRYRKS